MVTGDAEQTARVVTAAIGITGQVWSSRPGRWLRLSSVANVLIVSALALSGPLMAPLAPGDAGRAFPGGRRVRRCAGHRKVDAVPAFAGGLTA
jgi:hypothetical protein